MPVVPLRLFRDLAANRHSPVVTETKTFNVSLVSKDPSRAIDVFYKYHGQHLPRVGEIIGVVRFVRGRVIRAPVTYVDDTSDPPIAATQID
jgi:hypothetical protein